MLSEVEASLRGKPSTPLRVTLPFIVAFIFFISSCKKDTSTPLDFSKITVTDTSCIYISDVDLTDWTSDAAWTTPETAFLNFADTILATDSTTGYVQFAAPCPNPNDGLFTLGVNTEKPCKMKLVCVNTEMQVLYYTSLQLTGGPVATVYDFRSNTAFHKNENYRLYYGFYNSKDSLYYKGHGDLRVE